LIFGDEELLRSLLWLMAAAIAVMLTACTLPYQPANDSVSLSPEEIAGCFEINFLGRVFDRTPKQVRLFTERGSVGFEKGAYLVRAFPDPSKDKHEFSLWKPAGPGRVTIIWTNGFHVTEMRLDVYARELRGVAEDRGDVVIPDIFVPRSKVILRHIACS
jgi:hypothetical protein